MKITLKTIVLVSLLVFYLVIIFSNFRSYEGLTNEDSVDETDKDADEEPKKTEKKVSFDDDETKS